MAIERGAVFCTENSIKLLGSTSRILQPVAIDSDLNPWRNTGSSANIGDLYTECRQRLTKIIEYRLDAVRIRDRQYCSEWNAILGHFLAGACEIVD